MAKKATNKKPMFGNNRPFSLKTSRKIQKPNLQNVTINGETVKTDICEDIAKLKNIKNL